MRHTLYALLTLLPFSLFAASGEIDMHGGKEAKLTATMPTHSAKIFYGTILEIKPVMGYKYLKVDEDGSTRWVAISDAPVKVGEKIGYDKRTVMKDFKSKVLGKTFKEIIFANDIYLPQKAPSFGSLKDTLMATKAMPHTKPKTSKEEKPSKPFVKKEAYTIEEIHMWRKSLDKQTISITGKVYKVSKNIMKRDWVHLGDGTGEEKKLTDDLVFTAPHTDIKGGDTIKASGTVAVDKDFGYGYFYPVIIENAHIQKIKSK